MAAGDPRVTVLRAFEADKSDPFNQERLLVARIDDGPKTQELRVSIRLTCNGVELVKDSLAAAIKAAYLIGKG